jgi:hypothetical protein
MPSYSLSRHPERSQGTFSLSSALRSLQHLALPAITLTCALVFGSAEGRAQATPTAIGPGYGQHYIGGETAFLDANLYRRIGVEFEGRLLNFHTSEDVKEQTYLAGIKISTNPRNLRPYVKLLAGRGTLDFPFHYAVGSYFVVAPAAGLDWHLSDSRWSMRVVDFQYQIWPQFTFGELHPYGITSGVSYDLFTPGFSIRGRHFRH